MSEKRKPPNGECGQPPRSRTPHCVYRVTWFDFAWNEIEGTTVERATAHEMVTLIEAWNRDCQREARDKEMVVPRVHIPIHVSVEVIYVES